MVRYPQCFLLQGEVTWAPSSIKEHTTTQTKWVARHSSISFPLFHSFSAKTAEQNSERDMMNKSKGNSCYSLLNEEDKSRMPGGILIVMSTQNFHTYLEVIDANVHTNGSIVETDDGHKESMFSHTVNTGQICLVLRTVRHSLIVSHNVSAGRPHQIAIRAVLVPAVQAILVSWGTKCMQINQSRDYWQLE